MVHWRRRLSRGECALLLIHPPAADIFVPFRMPPHADPMSLRSVAALTRKREVRGISFPSTRFINPTALIVIFLVFDNTPIPSLRQVEGPDNRASAKRDTHRSAKYPYGWNRLEPSAVSVEVL